MGQSDTLGWAVGSPDGELGSLEGSPVGHPDGLAEG